MYITDSVIKSSDVITTFIRAIKIKRFQLLRLYSLNGRFNFNSEKIPHSISIIVWRRCNYERVMASVKRNGSKSESCKLPVPSQALMAIRDEREGNQTRVVVEQGQRRSYSKTKGVDQIVCMYNGTRSYVVVVLGCFSDIVL